MLGKVIVIFSAVVLLSTLFLTDSLSVSAFGLDFVPAFDGDTEAEDSMDGAGVWAIGDAGQTKSERRRAGDEKGLTQGETPLLMLDLCGRRGAAPRRRLLTTRQTRKGFAATVADSMRADGPSIAAPPFPRNLPWINVAMLRMDQQGGFPVLVEFWDFCRVNSLRTLPYLKAWHERYAEDGLRIIGIHTGGFAPARVEDNVRRAVERLEIPWAVGIDTELEVWDIYGNQGWPARYLWAPDRSLFSLHYGEGAYVETELEIQELLGVVARAAGPAAPRGRPGRADRGPDRGPAGRLLRPVRGGRRVGRGRGSGRSARQRHRRSRSPSRAASS